VKLFFIGRGHPNTRDVPDMLMYDRTVALAEELGLRDKTVFFNDAWVPYNQRQDYLLESDIGISTHFDSAETTFSFRTRLLDYFWAGLPMIVNSGDMLSELVEQKGLGYVVAPGDIEGLAAAILKLAAEPDRRESRAAAMAAVRERFIWERTLEPLVNFCRHPYHSADALRRRPHGAPAHSDAMISPTDLVRRIQKLDKVVAEKNDHIAELKEVIRRLENGRVMRALSRVQKLRGRS